MKRISIFLISLFFTVNAFAFPLDKIEEYKYKNVIVTFKDNSILKGRLTNIIYEEVVTYGVDVTSYDLDYEGEIDIFGGNDKDLRATKKGNKKKSQKRFEEKVYLIIRYIVPKDDECLEYVIGLDEIKYISCRRW